jgi:iron complex outermembrane receptor protein
VFGAVPVLLGAGLFSLPVAAQITDSSGRQVDEILVVAQKKGRAENLQEVPAAITAFNEEQLDTLLYTDFTDLGYTIPNVQLEEVGTFPGVQNFSIRGQGINSSIPSVDPTVGVFVDGVYLGVTYGTVLDTWDLESVEVLRGPQGLLFGRNVTGGAITVRTARPDPSGELGIKARVLATDVDRNGVSAAIEGPIVQDVFAAKLMGYYEDDDGYFDNVNPCGGAFGANQGYVSFDQTAGAPGEGCPGVPAGAPVTSQRNAGQFETKIARPSFVWTPSETLELALITEYGKAEGDGAAWTVINKVQPVPGLPPAVEGGPSGQIPEFSTTLNEYGFSDIEWKNATLEFNWDVFGGTLTNIAGWRDVEQSSATDIDGGYLPAFTAAGFTNQDQFSNELRFATTLMDKWDLTLGVYYLTQDIEYREGRYIQVNPATLQPTADFIRLALGGDMSADTYGIFWNNDITFAEDWTLTAGIRYSDEDKDTRIISGPTGAPPGGGFGPCQTVPDPGAGGGFDCQYDNLNGSWDNWTPKLGLRWQFLDNTQAYAFWTKGYRAGGFNFRNARPEIIPAGPTEQEEQNSYEVGLKTELFDRRLRMNVAYFFNDIQDIQRELNLPDLQVLVLQGTINAGDVEIRGLELEFQAVPIDRLSLFGSVGYLRGEYTRINPLWAGDVPGVVPPTPYIGDELPRLAPWSWTLGGSYDVPLSSYGLLNLSTDYGWRDRNFYDDSNTQQFNIQRRLRASVRWISPNDSWTVSVFGKNLLDEANYGNLTSIAGIYTAGPMQRGREYGLQVEYRL